jgi:hypothetical protein
MPPVCFHFLARPLLAVSEVRERPIFLGVSEWWLQQLRADVGSRAGYRELRLEDQAAANQHTGDQQQGNIPRCVYGGECQREGRSDNKHLDD